MQAQIVNVESKKDGALAEEGWHGNVNFNFSFVRNTTDILTYGNRSTVQWKKERNRLLFLTDLNRVQAAGADFVNQGFSHIRYNYQFKKHKKFSSETFQQAQFNAVQLIDFRYLVGSGISWNAIESDSLKFRIGSIPMFEYERLTTSEVDKSVRLSNYVLFFIKFDSFEFQTINYVQPKVSEVSDIRWSSISSLEFSIKTWLKYNISFELLKDTEVPQGVPEVVFTFQNGLGIEF